MNQNLTQKFQSLLTKNKLILAAIILIHVVFCVAIIQQVYKSLDDGDLASRLSLSSFFDRPLSLTVSSTGSKPVAIGEKVPYAAARLGLVQTLDTTQYKVFSETAQVTFAAGKSLSSANSLTIVDYTDKLSSENLAEQASALKVRLSKLATLTPVSFDFGEDVAEGAYAGFSYTLPSPLSQRPTWNSELFVLTRFARGYLIKFTSSDESRGPEQFAKLLNQLEFIDPTLPETPAASADAFDKPDTDPSNTLLERSIVKTQAAVKRVYSKLCADLELTSLLTSKGVKAKYLQTCTGNTGNGFYVGKSGDFATQAALIEQSTSKYVYNLVNTLQAPDLAIDLARAHSKQLKQAFPTKREDALASLVNDAALRQQLAVQAAQLAEVGQIKATFAAPEVYVQRGKNNLSIADSGELINPKDHYKSKLISLKEGVALLKVDQPGDYPVVTLSDAALASSVDALKKGYVVGYAELNTDADVFGTKTNANPKVAKVSSFKQAGLGGAPVISVDGRVLGLVSDENTLTASTATFKAEGATKLIVAMQQNGLANTAGTTDAVWNSALADFFDQKYTAANVKFTQAQQVHSDLVEAAELKLIAQARIAAGLDKTNDWFGLRSGVFGNFSDQAVLIFGLTAISTIAIAMGSLALINYIWKKGAVAQTKQELVPAVG